MRKLAFAAVVICLALYAWTVWYDRSLREEDPYGHRNLKACRTIAPGVAAADLARVLGAPERSEESGGLRRLFYHTHPVAVAQIMAEVDAATGRVLALHCPGENKPRWDVRP